jgi:hypothetical protein
MIAREQEPEWENEQRTVVFTKARNEVEKAKDVDDRLQEADRDDAHLRSNP